MEKIECIQKLSPETENILQSINDGYVSLDSEWKFTFANKITLALTGEKIEQLIGNVIWDVFPEVLGTNIEHQCRKVMSQRDAALFDTYYQPYDIWAEVRIYPHEDGIAIFFTDISAKIKVRQIVDNDDEWIHKVLDNFPLMVWASATNQEFNYFNNAWLNFTGHTAEQEKKYGWMQLIHKNDADHVKNAYDRAFKNRAIFTMEFRMKCCDGNYHWVNILGKPLYLSYKKFAGYIGCVIDINDEVIAYTEMENDVKRKTHDLIASLEAERGLNSIKSYFVSMASHQFRTPLTTVLSSTDLIDRYLDTKDWEQVHNHTGKIRTSIKHLIQLLNDFLSLEKLEQKEVLPHMGHFNLYDFIWEIISEAESAFKGGQRISFSYKGNHEVLTDKSVLYNIMQNLLSNAVKYSDKDIALQIDVNKANICASVSDKGIGIPEEEQVKLFSKYFRATNVGNIKGTGLGLNIVYNSVELLGGIINVTSKKDLGTTFTVQVPNGDTEPV